MTTDSRPPHSNNETVKRINVSKIANTSTLGDNSTVAGCNSWLPTCLKKGSPYSITERRVPELIPVHCRQPAGDLSHKPGGRLPLLSARHAVTLAACLVNRGTMV